MNAIIARCTTEPGYCLHAACAALRRSRAAGATAIIQAGTCLWPRLRPDQDDGQPNTYTHFGYEWQENPDAIHHGIACVARGKLPELHVWVAELGESPVIVDDTTGQFPALCRAALGLDWPGDLPPATLRCRVENLPAGVRYHPTMNAIGMAMVAIIAHPELRATLTQREVDIAAEWLAIKSQRTAHV